MTTIRRAYVSIVGYAALAMLVFGLANLIRVVLEQIGGTVGPYLFITGGDLFRRQVSFFAATTVVALPVAAIHLLVAARWVAPTNPDAEAERLARARRLALGAAFGLLGLAPAATAAWLVVDRLLRRLLGATGPAPLAGPFATLLVSGAVGIAAWRVAAADLDRSPDLAARNGWLRLVTYAGAATGLALFVRGLFGLVDIVVESAATLGRVVGAGGPWWAARLAASLASVAVGASLWAGLWRLSSQRARRADRVGAAERGSPLRRLALYGALAAVTFAALRHLAVPLEQALRAALGAPPSESLPPAAISAAALGRVAVLGAVGLACLHAARAEETLAGLGTPADERRDELRRLPRHVLAGAGLAVWATGLVPLLRALTGALMASPPPALLPAGGVRAEVAATVPLVVVGLVAWLAAWPALEREARADPAARASVVRRGYLALAAGAGVLMLLGSLASALYGVIGTLLGVAGQPWQRLVDASGWIVTGLFLVLYHGSLIRGDARAGGRAPATAAPVGPGATLVVRLPASTAPDAAAEAIRRALPGATVEAVPSSPPPE